VPRRKASAVLPARSVTVTLMVATPRRDVSARRAHCDAVGGLAGLHALAGLVGWLEALDRNLVGVRLQARDRKLVAVGLEALGRKPVAAEGVELEHLAGCDLGSGGRRGQPDRGGADLGAGRHGRREQCRRDRESRDRPLEVDVVKKTVPECEYPRTATDRR
jgi:hypothetical protein